jgi:hypothetical protein
LEIVRLRLRVSKAVAVELTDAVADVNAEEAIWNLLHY